MKKFAEFINEGNKVVNIIRHKFDYFDDKISDETIKKIGEKCFPRKRGDWTLKIQGENPFYISDNKREYPYAAVHYKMSNKGLQVNDVVIWRKGGDRHFFRPASDIFYPKGGEDNELEDLQDELDQTIRDSDFNNEISINGHNMTLKGNGVSIFVCPLSSFESISSSSSTASITLSGSYIEKTKLIVPIESTGTFYNREDGGQAKHDRDTQKAAAEYLKKYIEKLMGNKLINVIIK